MRIRTADGEVFYLNDYHFITLYRNVNSGNIHGGADAQHVVLLSDFDDWNGLAVAAFKASTSKFKFGGLSWGKKTTGSSSEIYLAEGGNTVQLSGRDIEALSLYLNQDIALPNAKRTRDFAQAQLEIEKMIRAKTGKQLHIQWPAKLPAGLFPSDGKTRADHVEWFLLGPTGHVEYPHVHLFISNEGYVYSAHATLSPDGSKEKRHFDLKNDLTFVREGTLAKDAGPLADMEKVVRHLVSGEDLIVAAEPKREKKVAEKDNEPAAAVDESAAFYVSYGEAWNVTVQWVSGVFPHTGLELAELGDYSPTTLVEMANTVPTNHFVVPKDAWNEIHNGEGDAW